MGRLVFQTGFDHYDTGHIAERWSEVVSGPSISAGGGRSGGALYCSGSVVQKNLPSNYGRLIAGFACKWTGPSNPGQMLTFTNNTPNLKSAIFVGTNSVGAVVVGDSDQYSEVSSIPAESANALVTPGSWYYFEIDINFASGLTVVHLNGLEIINGTFSYPQFSAGNVANQVSLGFGYDSSGNYFDDFYVIDPTDDTDYFPDTFLGDITVGAVLMAANGRVNNFIPSPDSNANWQNVDDAVPDDDATYNSSNVVNNVDTYDLAATTVEAVIGVAVVADMRKDNIGSRIVEIGLGNGDTEEYGDGIAVGDTYEMSSTSFGRNPFTNAAWEVADLTNLQTAIKVTA